MLKNWGAYYKGAFLAPATCLPPMASLIEPKTVNKRLLQKKNLTNSLELQNDDKVLQ